MPAPLPYRRALDSLVSEVLPGGRVVRARPMRGGLGSLMHAIDVEQDGVRHHLTLRRFNQPEWGEDEVLARREWDVLPRLHRAGLPVPEPLWADPTGERFTVPALLLRRLPGRPDLRPDDLDVWCAGIAGALVEVHGVDTGLVVDVLPEETREQRFLRYLETEVTDERLDTPFVDARRMRAACLERIEAARDRPISHGDYHAGNVLWSDDRISGVIDWGAVRLGDPRFDISYLRLDTALILGEDAADRVLDQYEVRTGEALEDVALWDVFAATTALPDPARWLPGYVEQGRDDLDAPTVRERYAAFAGRALETVTGVGS